MRAFLIQQSPGTLRKGLFLEEKPPFSLDG